MTQIRNIVILGASFGGLGAAHYVVKHILPKLQSTEDAKYVLHLVDPSTHFWWHIAAPRQICSLDDLTLEKSFVPIMDGFKQYGKLNDSIVFHHGQASALNTQDRTVTVALHEGGSESLDYYALVIATGIRSPTAATTFQNGNYTESQKALKDLNAKLATAKEVIISGGGPVGVETAGEVATYFNGKVKVTLFSGSDKILPVFNKSRAQKAQTLLEKAGVKVVHNVKVTGQGDKDGKTEVLLSNGESLLCDVYIPAYGVTPNTEFLPEDLKSKNGYVKTNEVTLRVDSAGSRVYAAGDVAGVDAGGALNMYSSIPVLGANIAHDLLADAKAGSVAEKKYTYKAAETQFVPVGPKTGVAAFNGWSVPGFVVGFAKGKDYMLGQMGSFTEGKKFAKA